MGTFKAGKEKGRQTLVEWSLNNKQGEILAKMMLEKSCSDNVIVDYQ